MADVLADFARTMLTDFPIQAILDQLVGRIVDVLPVAAAGVTLISGDEAPIYVAGSNQAAWRFEQLQTTYGEGPCLTAYHHGAAVSVADLLTEQRFPRFTAHALTLGLAAVFTFPLRHGDHQLGALDLYNDVPGPLPEEAMTAAQTLADVASAYLINAQGRADLQESWQRSRQAALHDPLTGLANRVLMLDRLENALQRNHRTSRHCAALFIDLDRLKAVNDSYGHAVGDELLVAVAQRLSLLIRPGDTVARLSGDEFAVLCDSLNSPAEAESIGARLTHEMARTFELSTIRLDVTTSIGISYSDSTEQTPEQLLREADAAMYQAKRNGGNQYQLIDTRQQSDAYARLGLELDLNGVVLRGELHNEYQPIVAAADGTISGFEALLRWKHPVWGAVPPSTLVPIAERTGQIAEIGAWVLRQAWTDRLRWCRPEADQDPDMSVNISPNQLIAPNFLDMVQAVLVAGSTSAERLTLEITESVLIIDAPRALTALDELRRLGVRIALDDFGTGYSSLSYLKRLPVDILKIDQSFIADIRDEPASRAIVKSVVTLAHDLGISVIAEGVETADQHALVSELGCDACQGYHFGRPMRAAKVDGLVRRGQRPGMARAIPAPRPRSGSEVFAGPPSHP